MFKIQPARVRVCVKKALFKKRREQGGVKMLIIKTVDTTIIYREKLKNFLRKELGEAGIKDKFKEEILEQASVIESLLNGSGISSIFRDYTAADCNWKIQIVITDDPKIAKYTLFSLVTKLEELTTTTSDITAECLIGEVTFGKVTIGVEKKIESEPVFSPNKVIVIAKNTMWTLGNKEGITTTIGIFCPQ